MSIVLTLLHCKSTVTESRYISNACSERQHRNCPYSRPRRETYAYATRVEAVADSYLKVAGSFLRDELVGKNGVREGELQGCWEAMAAVRMLSLLHAVHSQPPGTHLD